MALARDVDALATIEVRDTHVDGVAQNVEDRPRVPFRAERRRQLNLVQPLRELVGGQAGGAQLEQFGDDHGFRWFDVAAASGLVIAIAVGGARTAGALRKPAGGDARCFAADRAVFDLLALELGAQPRTKVSS